MSDIWSEQNQFQAWLDVELAACQAWSKLGRIPQEDVDRLYEKAASARKRSGFTTGLHRPMWLIRQTEFV